MTQDHRLFEDERADAAGDPVVHIAAADASVVYGNENVVRRGDLGFGFLFEFYVEGFGEDEGEVLRFDVRN